MVVSRGWEISTMLVEGEIPSRFDAAIAAALRGWPVFPLSAHSKIPAIKQWETDATTDRAQLEEWWSFDPDRNIGIACGPAGLVVIDLDTVRGPLPDAWSELGVRHGREVLTLLAQWAGEADPADTYTVLTPTGEHRYFLAPTDRRLRNTIGELGHGLGPAVDVRAWGGAVAAAGSVRFMAGAPQLYRPHPQRPYEPVPLPRWLVSRLTVPPPAPRTPVRLVFGGGRLDAYVAAAVNGETANVTNAQPGVRAITVFKAAAALGELVGAGVLDEQDAINTLLDAASVHDGVDDWTQREARGHVRNGIARGRDNPRRLDGLAT
jgi:hypothetical protein